MNRRTLTAIALCLLSPLLAAGIINQSAPRLHVQQDEGGGGDDTYAHGDSVTITGSGFGSTMPTFGFAGGVAGQLETTSTGSTPSNNGNPVEDVPTQKGTFSWRRFAAGSGFARQVEIVEDATRGKSLGKSQTSSGNYVVSSEYTFNNTIPASGKAYISYWCKATLTGSGGSAQYKLWRMMGDSNVSDTNTNLVGHFLAGSSNIHENPTGTNILMYGGSGDGYWNANGNWMRIEIKFIPGTQGNRDGKVLYRAFRGSSVPSNQSFSGSGYDIRTQSLSYPNSTRYSAFMWERWVGNGYSAVTWGEDDHYAQEGSFRRVEVWNTDTPSTATIREIQEPTSWSSTSITIRLNKGGLSAGTYYVVVLDDSETDTVLASKQITISQLMTDAPHVFDPLDAANDALIARAA